jgi:hypothetical protein
MNRRTSRLLGLMVGLPAGCQEPNPGTCVKTNYHVSLDRCSPHHRDRAGVGLRRVGRVERCDGRRGGSSTITSHSQDGETPSVNSMLKTYAVASEWEVYAERIAEDDG